MTSPSRLMVFARAWSSERPHRGTRRGTKQTKAAAPYQGMERKTAGRDRDQVRWLGFTVCGRAGKGQRGRRRETNTVCGATHEYTTLAAAFVVCRIPVAHTLGSMHSSLQSRLVVQKTMIRLLPPAPYTLTMSLIVLDRLVVDCFRANTTR